MKPYDATLAQQSLPLERWDLSRQDMNLTDGFDVPLNAPIFGAVEQRVPMWLFVADGQRVVCRRPVEVAIREEYGEVIAACERLHVFANGVTYEQAVESLSEQIVHFYNEYRGLTVDEVIGDAVQIRELYHRYFDIGQ